MGASSGATHHLGAMQKPQAKSKSTATTQAFKPRRDAPLTALPCRLGASESLAARAALPSVFSQAPRRAPRLGTPSGGCASIARLSRTECGIRAGRATSNIPGCFRNRVRLPATLVAAPEGVPKRGDSCARGAGRCPPRHDRRLGASYPAGAGYRLWLPPIPAFWKAGSYGLDALRPACRSPTARASMGAQRRWGATFFIFLKRRFAS